MTCTRRTPPRIAFSIAAALGSMPSFSEPWSRRRFRPLMSVYDTTELGSSKRSRMPCAPVHSTSFSADKAPPMAAATVSALILSNMPFESADNGLTTGIKPFSSSFSITAALTESMLPTNP
jgi:hypothetical protein